jgi:hypothetical protein
LDQLRLNLLHAATREAGQRYDMGEPDIHQSRFKSRVAVLVRAVYYQISVFQRQLILLLQYCRQVAVVNVVLR